LGGFVGFFERGGGGGGGGGGGSAGAKWNNFEIRNTACGWKHLLHTKISVNTVAAKVDNPSALSS